MPHSNVSPNMGHPNFVDEPLFFAVPVCRQFDNFILILRGDQAEIWSNNQKANKGSPLFSVTVQSETEGINLAKAFDLGCRMGTMDNPPLVAETLLKKQELSEIERLNSAHSKMMDELCDYLEKKNLPQGVRSHIITKLMDFQDLIIAALNKFR